MSNIMRWILIYLDAGVIMYMVYTMITWISVFIGVWKRCTIKWAYMGMGALMTGTLEGYIAEWKWTIVAILLWPLQVPFAYYNWFKIYPLCVRRIANAIEYAESVGA